MSIYSHFDEWVRAYAPMEPTVIQFAKTRGLAYEPWDHEGPQQALRWPGVAGGLRREIRVYLEETAGSYQLQVSGWAGWYDQKAHQWRDHHEVFARMPISANPADLQRAMESAFQAVAGWGREHMKYGYVDWD